MKINLSWKNFHILLLFLIIHSTLSIDLKKNDLPIKTNDKTIQKSNNPKIKNQNSVEDSRDLVQKLEKQNDDTTKNRLSTEEQIKNLDAQTSNPIIGSINFNPTQLPNQKNLVI